MLCQLDCVVQFKCCCPKSSGSTIRYVQETLPMYVYIFNFILNLLFYVCCSFKCDISLLKHFLLMKFVFYRLEHSVAVAVDGNCSQRDSFFCLFVSFAIGMCLLAWFFFSGVVVVLFEQKKRQ